MQKIREEEGKLVPGTSSFKLLELRKQLLASDLEGIDLGESVIKTGDKLTILFGTQEDNLREMNITLVEKNKDAGDISVASPLGLALYGRQVGETISYPVGDNVLKAKIASKLNYTK